MCKPLTTAAARITACADAMPRPCLAHVIEPNSTLLLGTAAPADAAAAAALLLGAPLSLLTYRDVNTLLLLLLLLVLLLELLVL
jgi:hypothetical protein